MTSLSPLPLRPLRTIAPLAIVLAFAAACGGAPAQDKTPATDTPAPASTSSAAAASSAAPTTASAPATASKPTSDEDEETSDSTKKAVAEATGGTGKVPPHTGSTMTLENLLGKPAGTDFPKAKQTDASCINDVNLSLDHDKDYDELGAKCGTATGLKPFTKKVTGELKPGHARDVYTFKMLGGYCYRFFATGDSGLTDLNILVQRPAGALVSVDQTHQPVAVLDPDRAWCKTHDREFHLVIETRGGQGKYSFGIWARPKT